MYTKEETIELLCYLKKADEENRLATPDSQRLYSYRSLLRIIREADSAEKSYELIGKEYSVTISKDCSTEEHYLPFKGIYYSEDCYEYLTRHYFSESDAKEITEVVRRGAYIYEEERVFEDDLSDAFIKWATDTGCLYSRSLIFNCFYREYEKMKFENTYSMPQIGRELTDVNNTFNNKILSHPETLYTEPEIKGKSSMNDEEGNQVVVTDYIAKKLIATDILDKINPVEMPANKTYLIKTHNGEATTKRASSCRVEERISMELYNTYGFSNYRLFVADYQTPICRDSSVKADESKHIGKIDLVSVDPIRKEIYLMELKKPDNTESLLRCVTEIYTYFKQIDKVRLSKEIRKKFDCRIAGVYKVIPAVLVFEGSEQHLQLRSKLFRNVQKLMLKLGVKFFIVRPYSKYGTTDFSKHKYDKLIIKETSVDVIK